MRITIEVRPEVEAALVLQAAARGRAVEAHVASLVEEAVSLPAGTARLSLDKLDRTIREMAEFSQKASALPDEAFTRESLCEDR